MDRIGAGMQGYLHTYEAYRIPKGTTVKDASGEDIILSEKEDTLVLTEKAGRQLVKDRKAHNGMLMMKAEVAAEKTQSAAAEKQAKDYAKIMAVYRAMAKGDVVPSGDERKLQEFDPDLYQMAKTAQSMARQAERKEHKSQWDEREENAHREKMRELSNESNEAAHAAVTGPKAFASAQKDHIVEIDSGGVDFSSMTVMSLGAGVTGAQIDLSV